MFSDVNEQLILYYKLDVWNGKRQRKETEWKQNTFECSGGHVVLFFLCCCFWVDWAKPVLALYLRIWLCVSARSGLMHCDKPDILVCDGVTNWGFYKKMLEQFEEFRKLMIIIEWFIEGMYLWWYLGRFETIFRTVGITFRIVCYKM